MQIIREQKISFSKIQIGTLKCLNTFKRSSKKNPKKLFSYIKFPKGIFKISLKKHGSWIATHGVKISTIVVSDWL